jgi:three-Cys-motif partner protein
LLSPHQGGEEVRAASYTVKEAAHIKNELLRAYLEPLLMIIGQREPRIGFIDCYCGPFGRGEGERAESSVEISLGIMEKCHNELTEKFRKNVQFNGLFIERDKGTFARIENFLESESWNGVDTHCLKGDFCDLQGEILSWCGNRDFCFFFIDATEWRHIAIPTLEPFLNGPPSEFFISFMFDSIVRAHGQMSLEEHVNAIFGKPVDASLVGLEEKDRALFNLYRRELKSCAPVSGGQAPRCAHMRVNHPSKDRTIYDLIYLTWNPLGIVTFMETSEQLEMAQRKTRAVARQSKKVKRSGQLELFSADRFVEDEPAVDAEKVKEYWLGKLSHAPKPFGVTEFADMLEETGWFMDHFQKAFLELEHEGKVRNLASTGMRTGNPVRYWANGNRGEFLEKLEEKQAKSR